MNGKTIHIQEYYHKIKSSNKELTKKEAFKDLLNRLYAGNNEIEKIIDKITLGAETGIVNIPRHNKLHRGSADTLYNNIIIEFENDLKQSSYSHAKEQLAGYLLGQFRSGEGYNYVLIASDFINWKVLSPNIDCIENIDTLQENELRLDEVASASFTLNETNAEDFYYWIDRFLFKEEKQKATLKRIEEAFGHQSPVFIESFREMYKWFSEAKKFGEVQVSFEQWHKFLSIAYGSFEANEKVFIIHTYLSAFSKILAYAVLSNDDYIDDDELKQVLEGSIFHHYNIANFVDNDFFHWIKSERNFSNLKKTFRVIAREVSAFDFSNIDEDILKGVYQELIDLDTRHSLGEYYTPDWLCERVVRQFEFTPTNRILDPSCGSGSFLRAVIHRIKQNNPSATPEELNSQIYGIDIHPLSVQIAKTTLLLTLGKEVREAKKPIHLNVILANTLLAPEGINNLFGNKFDMPIDKEKYSINTQVFDNVEMFDFMLEVCDNLAGQSMNKKAIERPAFDTILKSQYPQNGFTENLFESYYEIYNGLKKVKEKGRDSIWRFILSNNYKPYFLKNKFDYIIGNPPWFTYSSIKTEEYQLLLNGLAEKYDVKPTKAANFPHLEIAAIFQAYCSSYFLKEDGKLAFVLPRSFFNADHHDNTRSGQAKGFRLIDVWDLGGVTPLFQIPSCVLFSEKALVARGVGSAGVKGLTFSGTLPAHNCNWDVAATKLTETQVNWYYVQQGKSSAFSTQKQTKNVKQNPYKKLFKQGATIVPRTFYFVELAQDTPPDFDADRLVNLKTAEVIKADAKAPWKDITLSGRMECKFLFQTALSKSILPFALIHPLLVALPVTVTGNNAKAIQVHSADEIMNKGQIYASQWFRNCESSWESKRTERNRSISSYRYLDWQNKLSSQKLQAPYLVLYNASAKDANAVAVCRDDFDFRFIVESISYVFYTENINEAFYLTAVLNSTAPNLQMKDFQAKGLFGPRHVHKKILDVYFPKYSDKDKNHGQLALLSKRCHEKTKQYLETNPPQKDLTPMELGKLRVSIKKYLAQELEEIDVVVKKIVNK